MGSMLRSIILVAVSLALGVAIGGYLFADTQSRTFLEFRECENFCLDRTELLGLLGSVGIQKFSPAASSLVVAETDKTLMVQHPFPSADIHYVVIPKKDIKDAEDITQGDREYIMDAYTVLAKAIRENNLSDYKIITNGPGFQSVGYLHFHLVAEE